MNKRDRIKKKNNMRYIRDFDKNDTVLALVLHGDRRYFREVTSNAVRLETNQPFFRKGGVR